ncbi:transposase [Salinimonas sediminis]|nr:transposase [Salinimonas sediminis]
MSMPVSVNLDHITESISLDECYELLIESKFDPADEESFLAVAPLLKKLNNNKTFLAETLIDELAGTSKLAGQHNQYTPQVLLLKAPNSATNFFIRANIWLAKDDPMLQLAGEKSFFYHVPHDHNFNFLTAGYLGSGYESDYYEYDFYNVEGYPGEPVDLRFIERKKLQPEQIMLYRAHKDVHKQLPADELSVSLNIMPSDMFAHLKPQYVFNAQCTKIERPTATSNSSTEPAMHFIARCGGEAGQQFLENMARNSIIEEDRVKAVKAMTAMHDSPEGKLATLQEYGFSSGSNLVRSMAYEHARSLALL